MTNEEIIVQIRNGYDREKGLESLCSQSRGLLYEVAKKYRGSAELDDLIQEGYIGLLKAADKWNPEEGTAFTTYARYWVDHAMESFIYNCSSSVRIPVYKKELIRKYKKYCGEYETRFGCPPSAEQICAALQLTPDQAEQIRIDIEKTKIRSLDEPITDDSGSITLGETVESPTDQIQKTVDEVYQKQLESVLWGAVECLEPTQKDVIKKVYRDGQTIKECAKNLQTSEGTVRGIHAKAIRALRKPKTQQRLKPFTTELYYSLGLKRTGVGSFKDSGFSSTEWAALKLIGEI